MNQNIKKKIFEALLKAIQESGQRAFEKSQENVPVVTGDLKRSGVKTNLQDGMKIEYKKEYASFVEFGKKAGTVVVPSFFRRDGKYVHSYKYYTEGQKAQHFIEKGMTLAYETYFPTIFMTELKSALPTATITKE
jgi:hypothetical protein